MMTIVARNEGRRPAAWRRSTLVIPAAMLAFALPACGDQKDASVCTAFVEYLDVRSQLYALDPTAPNAAQAKEIGEDYLAAVNRLEQAADGRYTQQLDGLDTAVRNILLTLASVQDDADYSTWRPLIDDDLETAQDWAQQVIDAIAPSCESVVSVPSATSAAQETSGT
jgi:hypothetical protein